MLPGLKKRVVNLHDVIMYVAIARRHIRLMVLLLCFCWLGALVFYVYSRPVYMSRALIKTDTIDLNKTAERAFGERSRVSGLAGEMTLPHIIERTAARLGVRAGARDIQKYYVKKLVARRDAEDNIEIEVYLYSYDWAKRWPETLTRTYLDYRAQRRKDEMDQRTETRDLDRKKLLKMIEDYRSTIAKSEVNDEVTKAGIAYSVLANTPVALGDARRKVDTIRTVRIQVTSPELDTIGRLSLISSATANLVVGTSVPQIPNATPPAAPSNTIILQNSFPASPQVAPATQPHPAPEGQNTPNLETPQARREPLSVVTPDLASESTWKNEVRQINLLHAQRSELLQTKQPGHKSVLDLDEQINALKIKLEGELTTELERLDLNYRELTERIIDLEKKLPELEKAKQSVRKATEEQGLVGGSLQQWLAQLRRIELEYENDAYAFDRDKLKLFFHGITQINENPMSPNRLSLLIYATALGLMLAIGVPFLIEYLDHTLSNMEEVEATFQLRGLGIIPKLATSDEQTGLLDRHSAKETNLLENFRVIRTNLLSMGAVTKPPQVVIVTSAMPREGKTFVSSNLALSFAQTGAKTLLMDTDLRRGRLHRLFGYRKQPGLSGVLLDQVSLDEAIRPTSSENLFMLSAGQHLETGTELLGSQKFIDILAELKKRFDRIVMDTPPVLGLSETSILQNHVDGVLFVIWSGKTPIKSVKAAIEILQSNGANFYGFVLNRLDLSATVNYYQYYYYSHDYYYQYQPSGRIENSLSPPSNSGT